MFDVVLTFVDSLLAFIPVWGRVTLWGIVMGAGTMLMYGWISDQDEIGEIKERAEEARKEMQAYDGEEFEPIWTLAKRSLSLSFEQLKVMLGPTMAAGVPIILLLIWMEGAYTHQLPAEGEVVETTIAPAEAVTGDETGVFWSPKATPVEGEKATMRIRWPGANAEDVALVDGDSGDELVTLPLEHPRPRLSKKSWDNWLFANPNGYLPQDGPVATVSFEFPLRHLVPFGPSWLRTWHALFLTILSAAAIIVKVAFGID